MFSRSSTGRGSIGRSSLAESIRDTFVEPAKTINGLACGGGTPWTALKTALVVGSLLVIINQYDKIIDGEWPPWPQIVLTYCVPYCVNTWGAIKAKMKQAEAGEHIIESMWKAKAVLPSQKNTIELSSSSSEVSERRSDDSFSSRGDSGTAPLAAPIAV